MKENLVRWMD